MKCRIKSSSLRIRKPISEKISPKSLLISKTIPTFATAN